MQVPRELQDSMADQEQRESLAHQELQDMEEQGKRECQEAVACLVHQELRETEAMAFLELRVMLAQQADQEGQVLRENPVTDDQV